MCRACCSEQPAGFALGVPCTECGDLSGPWSRAELDALYARNAAAGRQAAMRERTGQNQSFDLLGAFISHAYETDPAIRRAEARQPRRASRRQAERTSPRQVGRTSRKRRTASSSTGPRASVRSDARAQRHVAPAPRTPKSSPVSAGICLLFLVLGLYWAGTTIIGATASNRGGDPRPVDRVVPESATQLDPATGELIPAVGTWAREDMERREIECFDSGQTDCADHPGEYLEDPGSYP